MQIYAVALAGIVWAEHMTELQRIENDRAFGFEVMLGAEQAGGVEPGI